MTTEYTVIRHATVVVHGECIYSYALTVCDRY